MFNKDFKNATATIEFIRIFDWPFYRMNVRNILGKGFKSFLKLSNHLLGKEYLRAVRVIFWNKNENQEVFYSIGGKLLH